MSFRAYPSYQDSGACWLGDVPSHWSVDPVKHHFSIVGGSTPKSDIEEYWDGGIPWVTPADLSKLDGWDVSATQRTLTPDGLASCSASLVPAGSVILSTRAPIGSLGITAVDACTNQGCKALVPNGQLDARLLAYLLATAREELQLRGKGTTFLELSGDELGRFAVPLAPGPEQAAITAFLDRETAKIDALVEEQRRLIELLKEKRQAVISHAVTKGLDPTVPMKDSGVEWVGDVPAHWEVKPLKWLTPSDRAIMYGIVLPGPDVGAGVPIVKGGDVKEHRLSLASLCYTTTEIEAPFARARLRPNDIVYSIRGSIGDAELVPAELLGANITQDVARISPLIDVNPHWLVQVMRSKPVFAQLEQRSLGATIRGINIFDLKRAYIPVPPRHEQDAITEQLSIRLGKLSELERAAAASIELMQEHRAALISAAVTGKIDVRDAVAQQAEAA